MSESKEKFAKIDEAYRQKEDDLRARFAQLNDQLEKET